MKKNKTDFNSTSRVHSITLIAGDYPTKNHLMLVFVQQLVHAIIDMGIEVTVIAPQSIIHACIHRVKLFPKHSIEKTENGNVYHVYRPYVLSFGNCKILENLARWIKKIVVLAKVRRIKRDVLYAHFWSNALPVYKYALKEKKSLFVACGEGDDA